MSGNAGLFHSTKAWANGAEAGIRRLLQIGGSSENALVQAVDIVAGTLPDVDEALSSPIQTLLLSRKFSWMNRRREAERA
eukprot:11666924-Prorocentrum_lima.AAC.1